MASYGERDGKLSSHVRSTKPTLHNPCSYCIANTTVHYKSFEAEGDRGSGHLSTQVERWVNQRDKFVSKYPHLGRLVLVGPGHFLSTD